MAADTAPATSSRQALRGLAANRDYRLMWLGDTVSQAGSSASVLAYPLLALSATGSVLDAGLIATAGFVAQIVGQVPAGYLGDAVNRRRLIVGSGILHGFIVTAITVMAATGRYTSTGMLALSAAGALTATLRGPAKIQALRILVERRQLAEAVAVTTGRGYALDLVMPAAGGALFTLHPALPFAVDAVTFWFAAASTALIRTDLGPDRRATWRPPSSSAFTAGWSLLWRDAFLRGSTLYATVSNLLVSAVLYTVLLGNGAVNAWSSGLAVTAAAAAGLLGATVAPHLQRRHPLHHVLVLVCGVRAALVLATCLVDQPLARVAALVAVMFWTPVTATSMATAKLLRVDADVLGRVSSAQNIVGSLALPLAPILAGALVHAAGPLRSCVVLGAGFAVLAAGAALVRGLRVWAAE